MHRHLSPSSSDRNPRQPQAESDNTSSDAYLGVADRAEDEVLSSREPSFVGYVIKRRAVSASNETTSLLRDDRPGTDVPRPKHSVSNGCGMHAFSVLPAADLPAATTSIHNVYNTPFDSLPVDIHATLSNQ